MGKRRKWTLREVRAEVARMDPNLDSAAFAVAEMMVSALIVGANKRRIATLLGRPIATFRTEFDRLQSAGVFRRDGRIACEWDKPKGEGGVAFWLDAAIAQGLLRRTRA
jgi:hypothetical protein